MPLVRIDLHKGKPAAYRKAICDGVYRAMREAFTVPDEDRFVIVTEHDAENFQFSKSYLDIARSDDLVIIQITANNTRTLDQKKAFFKRTADLLAENPGVRTSLSRWSRSARRTGRSTTASRSMREDVVRSFAGL